jgi:hypothetical protein
MSRHFWRTFCKFDFFGQKIVVVQNGVDQKGDVLEEKFNAEFTKNINFEIPDPW